MKKLVSIVTVCVMLIMMSSCAAEEKTVKQEGEDGLYASIHENVDSPEWVETLAAAKGGDVSQLFVVAAFGKTKTTACVSLHEKDENGNWKEIMSTPGYVGKYGLCEDAEHVEGCGQTPMGTYKFNRAFGIADDPGCAIPYTKVDEDTYWSGDAREGMHYNEMVDIKDYPDLDMTDSEHIVDYDYQYQYCLNISFNEDGTPGRGSAIFLHCLGPQKPYTGGCVAIPENQMKKVMKHVKEDCVVIIDMLDELAPELWDEWGLAVDDENTEDGENTEDDENTEDGDLDFLPMFSYNRVLADIGYDSLEAAAYDFLAFDYMQDYDISHVLIPYAQIVGIDETDSEDVLLYGDYYVWEFAREGDTLVVASGGHCPGIIHLERFGDAGEGAVYSPKGTIDEAFTDDDAVDIFGDYYEQYQALSSDDQAVDSGLSQVIADYVAANDLDITKYQMGGEAKELPKGVDYEKKEIIGIIGAMDEEVNSLKEAAGITKTTTIAGMDFCEGRLGEQNVIIVKCGIGKVNAGICANTLINDFGCTRVINTGIAGSLDNQIDIGDIVVSVDAVQHDYDVEAIGFAKGEIPYTGLYAFPADESLRKAAVDAVHEVSPEIHVFEGRVCSGDQFISTVEQKDRIISDFGGMCCEMEGGSIAQACYLNSTPYVVIRAISDKPDETEIVEYQEFEAEAAARCASIVLNMVEHIAG